MRKPRQLTTIYKILTEMPYYAVAKGRRPGIYNTWDECKVQVHQFPAPRFKKFSLKSEAEEFIKQFADDAVKINTRSNVFKSSFPAKKKERVLTEYATSSTGLKRKVSASSDNNLQPAKQLKIYCENESSDTDNLKNRENFIVDKDGYVSVFTDGACSSNGDKNAMAGLGVWFGDNHKLNISRAVIGRATNNTAEIQAVTVAVQQAKSAGINKLKINTDSKFLISCITKWMPKWKANGWKTVNNKPVINKTELIEMEKALDSMNILWNHVNGHVGIHGNEMADKLARAGCSKYQSVTK